MPFHERALPVAFGLLGLVLAAVAVVVLAGGQRPGHESNGGTSDLMVELVSYTHRLKADAPYRDPSSQERTDAVEGLRNLLQRPPRLADAKATMEKVGYSLTEGTDPATGRRYAMFASKPGDDRPWGIILVDLSLATQLAIEIPHPNSDLKTERVGVQLFRKIPGSMLLMAGAHRRAGGGKADVAHNKGTMFNSLATEFARRNLPQLQVHGFADLNLPDSDIVVSNGSAHVAAATRRVGNELADAGFVTCRAWQRHCGRLEGTTNVQGQTAERFEAIFIHLEISYSVRNSDASRQKLADAIAKADIPAG